jgi:hypothetical protein
MMPSEEDLVEVLHILPILEEIVTVHSESDLPGRISATLAARKSNRIHDEGLEN